MSEIMAEEMQPETKVAFMNKPYTSQEKRQREEEELEQLLKEQRGETEEVKKKNHKKLNQLAQKKKHLRSVTVTCVGICKTKKKSFKTN